MAKVLMKDWRYGLNPATGKIENYIYEYMDNNPDDVAAYNARQTEEASAGLEIERARVLRDLKTQGLANIKAQLPAVDTIEEVQFAATWWNMWSNPSAAQTAAKNIYLYFKQQAAWAKDPARTLAELQGYDPLTDPNWPTA